MRNQSKNAGPVRDDSEELVTKGYLRGEFEIFEEKFEKKTDQKFSELMVWIKDGFGKEFKEELREEIQKQIRGQGQDFERRVGAVIEQNKEHVKIIAEGFAMQIEASERKWMSQEEVNSRHALRIARIEALCA